MSQQCPRRGSGGRTVVPLFVAAFLLGSLSPFLALPVALAVPSGPTPAPVPAARWALPVALRAVLAGLALAGTIVGLAVAVSLEGRSEPGGHDRFIE